jgi:hypothetical protein
MDREDNELLAFMWKIDGKIEVINQKLDGLTRKVDQMSGTTTQLQTDVAALQTAVANDTTVEQSAITLINGIPAMITNAVAAAMFRKLPYDTVNDFAMISNRFCRLGSSSRSPVDPHFRKKLGLSNRYRLP